MKFYESWLRFLSEDHSTSRHTHLPGWMRFPAGSLSHYGGYHFCPGGCNPSYTIGDHNIYQKGKTGELLAVYERLIGEEKMDTRERWPR